MRVAIYARVSTEDKGQGPGNQLRDLRAWCTNSGHDILDEYIDRVSGRKGRGERKQFAALFEDASRRKFECVVFWALDRFSREGMVPTIHHLERLNSYGVTFHSYTEPHLCADNEMVRVPIMRWSAGSCWRCSPPWPSRRPSGFPSALATLPFATYQTAVLSAASTTGRLLILKE